MRARNQRITQFHFSIATENYILYISTEPAHQFIKWSELYFTMAEKLDSKSDPLLTRSIILLNGRDHYEIHSSVRA